MQIPLSEILEDLHTAENDCQNFEKKYGILSEDFYAAYSSGSIENCGSNPDFTLWAGSYKIKLSRINMYRDAVNKQSSIFQNLTLAEEAGEAA
ncbi:MAG: hypothetical protein ACE5I1_03215 [bacterium]